MIVKGKIMEYKKEKSAELKIAHEIRRISNLGITYKTDNELKLDNPKSIRRIMAFAVLQILDNANWKVRYTNNDDGSVGKGEYCITYSDYKKFKKKILNSLPILKNKISL